MMWGHGIVPLGVFLGHLYSTYSVPSSLSNLAHGSLIGRIPGSISSSLDLSSLFLPRPQLRPAYTLERRDLPAGCGGHGVLDWSRVRCLHYRNYWLRCLFSARPSCPLCPRHLAA